MSSNAGGVPNKKNVLLRYLAGGCLANIPLWVLLVVASFGGLSGPSWMMVAYCVILGGTAIAGYLVLQEATHTIKIGIATAFASYIVYVFSVTLLLGNVILLPTGDYGDFLLLLDFAAGGILW